MLPSISKALRYLKDCPSVLDSLNRGIERETLRVTTSGELATSPHPPSLGAALTNKWITTDFAEAMLELITPVHNNIESMLDYLHDLHGYTARNLAKNERMWPFSMPCHVADEQLIQLAQYGSSNQGKFKTIYRRGLKYRYGALMQTISGVHYNFSLPESFWQSPLASQYGQQDKDKKSEGYFKLIRNYYRFGWIIPYLFGASPTLSDSFLKNKKSNLPFESLGNGILYLPYATSLRMSDLGYINKSQHALGITFNHLTTYVEQLRKALHTHSKEYEKIGVYVEGEYRQLNSNLLQIENEFYAPIRPKRVILGDESPSAALLRGGIEYIEVRALDINPFSAVGVDAEQIRLLDLFLIWCILADAPEMSEQELNCARSNWDSVILNGRKPGQTIGIGCGDYTESLSVMGRALLEQFAGIAELLDQLEGSNNYLQVCNKWEKAFIEPEMTLSGQLLQMIKNDHQSCLPLTLAEQYYQQMMTQPFRVLTEEQLEAESKLSLSRQKQKEQQDQLSFEEYLRQHAN